MTFRPCYVLAVFGVLILSSAIELNAQAISQKDFPALNEIDVPVSRLEMEVNVKPVAEVLQDELTKTKEQIKEPSNEELEKQIKELEKRDEQLEAEIQGHKELATVASHTSSDESKPFRQLTTGSTPTGWIQIGTPKKWLKVIFDTGSDKLVAKTWKSVQDELTSVDQGVGGMVMPSNSIYNDLNSSSYHRRYTTVDGKMIPMQTTITYGSGPATTDVGTENVLVGNRHLDNFTLMEITADSLQMLHTSKGIAGILGLQHMKNQSLGHSLFSRLRDEDLLTSFGYCRGTNNTGTFIWGDDSTEGQELEVIGQMHWALKLGSVSIYFPEANKDLGGPTLIEKEGSRFLTGDGKSDGDASSDTVVDMKKEALTLANTCPDNKCTAILDTGSNIIAGPKAAMEAATNLVNVKPDCSNYDDLPIMKMTIGGMEVSIPPSGYVMKVPMPEKDLVGEDEQDDGADDGAEDEQQDSLSARPGDVVVQVEPSYVRRERILNIEMGLAETRASRVRARVRDVANRRWKGVFERLHRDHGVDLREAVDKLLKQHNGSAIENSMCMPALVPLDANTVNGPLWIVGTPLLDAYYARWSFKKGDESPKIHLKDNQDCEVCKEGQDHDTLSPPGGTLLRTQKATSDADVKPATQKRGPTTRLPEEISYPHWAKDLLHI